MPPLVHAQDPIPGGRRVVVCDYDLASHLFDCDALFRREPMTRVHEHDQFVTPERNRLQILVRRLECQDAEVEAALEQLACDLARRDPADLDARLRVQLCKPFDDRQYRMDRRFIRADDHPAPPDVLELTHGGLRLGRQAQQS